MACQAKDHNNIQSAIELLSSEGFEGLAGSVGILINEVKRAARAQQISSGSPL